MYEMLKKKSGYKFLAVLMVLKLWQYQTFENTNEIIEFGRLWSSLPVATILNGIEFESAKDDVKL